MHISLAHTDRCLLSDPIKKITAYKVNVPIKDGTYTMSGGRSLDAFDTTIICVETRDGLQGWGEITPLGANYLPSYPEGARTGIKELAPALIGCDPTEIDCINHVMDDSLKGHPYVKTALDIACWDLFGKTAGLPVVKLLGGRFGTRIKAYRSITHDTPEVMVGWIRKFSSQGYRHFQLKIGADAETDIIRIQNAVDEVGGKATIVADANGGWTLSEAARVMRAIEHLDVYIEQPCRTYEECLSLRRRFKTPFVLDESIDSMQALQRAIADGAMDCINIKLSKFGGLTRSRAIRDLCVQNGVRTCIEDTACTDITAAAVAQLAHSTPQNILLCTTFATVKTAFATAIGGPEIVDGHYLGNVAGAGLGVQPILDVLGEPIFTIH
ncbi:hypothetical protein ASD45_15465 [Pseudolabrys sp. Root1462]|nr:hypothetical protein ASD45_15465 [Pseudolabrys sp. Root1462]